MAETIAAVLGWTVLLGGAVAVVVLLVRRSARHGILAPVVLGTAVRIAVVLIAHAGSVSLGDEGIFYLDDQGYLDGATRLSGLWEDGSFPDPSNHDVLGTYQIGYESFLAVLFTAGTASLLVGKLANALIGGVTVYLVARIAGGVLGERWQRPAAWLAAFAPTLVWWTAPLIKEAIVAMLVALGVLAATTLPRRASAVTFAIVLALLVVLRIPAALGLIVGTGAAIAIAGREVERRRLSRPLVVYAGALVAGLVVVVVAASRGNIGAFVDQYSSTTQRMADLYQGSNPLRAPYDALKSLVTPLPWEFDEDTRNWYRPLYPGVWLLICLYPLAAIGAWRLRRRPEAALLVGVIATVLVTNAFTSGFAFRQRSAIEPLVLVLALAGARSWWFAGRYAAGALGVTAVIAGVQSGSPIVALAILAAAAGVYAVTRRLPDRPFDPLPESPLVASLRARHGQRETVVSQR